VLADTGHGEASPVRSGGQVTVDREPSGGIRLQARDVPLGVVMAALSSKAKVPIRFRQAPDRPVTISCHGQDVRPILRCLLGEKANLFVQYTPKGLSGVTVLASTFENNPNGDALAKLTEPASQPSGGLPTLEAVQEKLRSGDADERALGLELLGRIENLEAATLRAAYEEGLKDPDGDVRAAALAGIAVLDGARSSGLLSEAMNDRDPSVRLAAVDGMPINPETRPALEKALSDPDEAVRELAGLRLGVIQ